MIITIDLIKELIIKYDYEIGCYPESEYEGLSVYEFICEQLKIPSGFENCNNTEYANIFKVFKNE